MEIKGMVHCLFEQSGTFKNEFIKLGIPAEDYDIQNNFGQTDNIIDLFLEIKKGYTGGGSIFDKINKDDLIIAFFPCIEFSCQKQMLYSLTAINYKGWEKQKIIDYILELNQHRTKMYELLLQFCSICISKNIRMIFENPYSEQTFLKTTVFLKHPTLIDKDRTKRGDFFKKPTAYWFWNCEKTNGRTFQQTPKDKIKYILYTKRSSKKGLCSESRSMISSDYARNFICDFILGKEQPEIDKQMKLNI